MNPKQRKSSQYHQTNQLEVTKLSHGHHSMPSKGNVIGLTSVHHPTQAVAPEVEKMAGGSSQNGAPTDSQQQHSAVTAHPSPGVGGLSVQTQSPAHHLQLPQPGSQVVFPKDVEYLVAGMKETLKLGSPGGGAASPGYFGGGHKMGLKMGGGRSGNHPYGGRRTSNRATPYHVPPSSRVGGCELIGGGGEAGKGPSQLKRWNHRRRYPSTCMSGGTTSGGGATGGSSAKGKEKADNPFEMLQELISDGSLIKEAVRRLQVGLGPKLVGLEREREREERRDFYDSDDECRTPPAYKYYEDDLEDSNDSLCSGVGRLVGGAPNVGL